MSVLGGHPLLSHVLICMALLSGVGVVSVKAPIRSLVASIAQTFLLAGWLLLQGSWILGVGVLLIFGVLYLRALQFFRAMGLAATQTQHRLRYSQVVGLLGGILFGLFIALQLVHTHQILLLYAWMMFAIGLSGVMARRNAFVFLLSLQMMFMASMVLWVQSNPAVSTDLIRWGDLILVAVSAYWLVGWSFFVNRLIEHRSLDIDAVHMLKN